MSETTDRRHLRRALRAERRGLTPATRRAASRRACARLRRLPWFRQARDIALYLPLPDEADPRFLADRDRVHRFFVPAMVGHDRMRFARLDPRLPLRRNRFGIPEPRHPGRRLRRPATLDLVVMPLVGFDDHCNRLGQGGGHYDRAFSFLVHRRLRHGGPRLVGLAFECQRVTGLPHRHWDVPLDAVVTEADIHMR